MRKQRLELKASLAIRLMYLKNYLLNSGIATINEMLRVMFPNFEVFIIFLLEQNTWLLIFDALSFK